MFSLVRDGLARARVEAAVVDTVARVAVVGGASAPGYKGSRALRMSRAFLEVRVVDSDTAPGRSEWIITEGASVLEDMTPGDSALAPAQTSRLVRAVMRRVDARARGCS